MAALADKFSHNVKLSTVDVTDFTAVKEWSNSVLSKHPRVDLLVCNAGVCEDLTVPWELEPSTFSKVVDTNIKGVFHTVKSFVPAMVRQEHGIVVNISSGLGRSTNPEYGAYCSSKFAVEALSKCIAQALPVTMACVPLAPGVVKTGMTAGQFAGADEWAKDAAPFILDEIGPSQNGMSLHVPGYYTDEYMNSWIIRPGQPLPALGMDFETNRGLSHL
jgi:NADP-dependent 3-hydroxy acid dehydrogenase YdfG